MLGHTRLYNVRGSSAGQNAIHCKTPKTCLLTSELVQSWYDEDDMMMWYDVMMVCQAVWNGHCLARELAQLALDHTCDGDVEWRVAEICKNWEERQLSERGIGAESATALHLHQTMSSFQTRVLGELETIRAGMPASRDTGERFHAALLHAWEEVMHGIDCSHSLCEDVDQPEAR